MKGIGVSPGIAIGRAYWLRQLRPQMSGVLLADDGAVAIETAGYGTAVTAAMDELMRLIGAAGGEEAAILEVQVELLQDPAWEEEVLRRIKEERVPARDAVLLTMEQFVALFENMEDAYLRARTADVKDMGLRLYRRLAGDGVGGGAAGGSSDGGGGGDRGLPASDGVVVHSGWAAGEGVVDDRGLPAGEGWIVVAEELSPSDMMSLDVSRVGGFVTRMGGKTSHAAIVARLRGLPAVAGVQLGEVSDGDMVLIDGESGVVVVNPTALVMAEYQEKKAGYLRRQELLRSLKDRPAVTRDGITVHLQANIGSVQDMEQAVAFGAEGVGLLRTELLFMEGDQLPTEDAQFNFYKNVLLRSGGHAVTIRTLDIGGDKPLPYLGLPKEENPFLGYRAIRICLDRKDLFLTQLRAILRAGVFGPCRIMFPMIGGVEELIAAKAVVNAARQGLHAEGIAHAADVPVGVMIEIPSAALTADLLAKEADFFSIGTNDLCQYTLAVDRMNERIAALYDPFHPAVLRLIRMVIEEGGRAGIPVGMCGEMAGDVRATELLFQMGLREFSMAAPSIPEIKEIIIRL